MIKYAITFEQVDELENLAIKFEQLANMGNTIHNAMFHGGNTTKTSDDAMYLYCNLLHQFKEELNALTDVLSIGEEEKSA